MRDLFRGVANRRRGGLGAGVVLLLIAVWVAVPPQAAALPLYASREGATCVTCHFDPNGGGMRNEFGFYYGRNRHSMGAEDRWANVKVTPQVNDWIRLGLDTRFMYYASHVKNPSPSPSHNTVSTFFPMEGQMRIALTPLENLTVIGTQGIVVESGYPNSYVARELYALFHGFKHGVYFQAGRFRSPFGLRQEDHTSYTRQSLPFDSQREDAGVEVGATGKHWFGQFAVTNGAQPFAQNAGAFAAKIGRAAGSFQFGLSGYARVYSGVGDVNSWSAYASTTRGPVTVLAEFLGGDLGGSGDEAAFLELVYRVSRGVNLRGKVDEYDYNIAGVDKYFRYLAEVDLNPMPFTNIKVSYRHYSAPILPDLDEGFAMLFVPF
ncbi:MAG: hypothetical protein ACRENN_05465 [Candidatus Eiseniibacteriota bacterium]